jgi:hypothetical protein
LFTLVGLGFWLGHHIGFKAGRNLVVNYNIARLDKMEVNGRIVYNAAAEERGGGQAQTNNSPMPSTTSIPEAGTAA